MKNLNKINDIFDIGTDVELPAPTLPVVVAGEDKESDFALARSTLHTMITKNDDVISELINIAKNSEHPRAFEVVGKLVEAQTNIAKELMNLHKTKSDAEGGSKPSKIESQTNIVFSGSTSDLMKAISAERARTIDASR